MFYVANINLKYDRLVCSFKTQDANSFICEIYFISGYKKSFYWISYQMTYYHRWVDYN